MSEIVVAERFDDEAGIVLADLGKWFLAKEPHESSQRADVKQDVPYDRCNLYQPSTTIGWNTALDTLRFHDLPPHINLNYWHSGYQRMLLIDRIQSIGDVEHPNKWDI